ncbi:cobW-domain-containing protein [Trametes versicolor FP-101664 SS1]|uniref:cobW-domain-containing protein n=1 Tax=Trametes versicolor (strain FP-101664) TaxID=717944 RepID=UPI0004621BE1|nr:cobW-domain-containing protein [Trametes versicolor FP-101664 SS1]EIW57787.1 cobW-domain-containing protein [Trametes versicolor FP-101664 SS1]
MAPTKNIPITVFTGFLGAGKTSIILSLLPRLPKDYKVVLLKNEFGDVEVDSQLAKQSSLAAVSEILNGCMCCVLVGQMKNALLEIREKFRPDRIFIECSGSAFPATLAFQIRELERETSDDLKLDAIVTVIDAENFAGYEDTSPTAKMQASYTDAILINKWEHISERALDLLIDHLNTLNDTTPKIKCQGRAGVDPAFILGLDTTLFQLEARGDFPGDDTHHDEVETVTLLKGYTPTHAVHTHGTEGDANTLTHDAPGDATDDTPIAEQQLVDALSSLSKETVWRVKGFVRLERGLHILNWAFGRHELTPFDDDADKHRGSIKLTVMGERGEVKRAARKLAEKIGAQMV